MRASGILLHISSLPSKYGIGSYGKEAYRFVDFLEQSEQTYWQILPLGPTSYGDSPYQTFSAFANNPYFIDLDSLVNDKLLRKNEIISTFESPRYVDYQQLYQERFVVLKKAFRRFNLKDATYLQFVEENKRWLNDYALFMAIKIKYNGASWSTWDLDLRLRKSDAISEQEILLKEDINFYKFLQYKASQQWIALKKYANHKGIMIIGDMPIYVSFDSSDVWANPEYFDLNDEKIPLHIAGVPPDLYSKEGQLWGNPLYHWDYLEKNKYQWWVDRVQVATQMFDRIRIDHFIGFQNFFSIPYGQKTAVNGTWEKGPGIKLFNAIKEKLGNVNIIAEDLGVVTDDVKKLLLNTGFPGMKLLQFAFDAKQESDYLPHLYQNNVVVYTGTHDNETTKTWFSKLSEEDLNYCLKYMNHSGKQNKIDSLIKLALSSIADTAIIPMQDYLHIGAEGRMNTPSKTGDNWQWRLLSSELKSKLVLKIKDITTLYGRGKTKDDSSILFEKI